MFCPIRHVSEVKNDPQALANQYMKPFSHPRLGEITLPGFPVSFSECRAETRTPAPQMGEHTDAILSELGYTADEVEKMKQDGVVRS